MITATLERRTQSTAYAKVWQHIARRADEASRPDPVQVLRDDRTKIFEPMNVAADSWQRDVLQSTAKRLMLLCSRQAGKSFIMAACALLDALLHPDSEVLVISRTLRQGLELMRKLKELWRGLTGGKVHRRQQWRPNTLGPEAVISQLQVQARGWDGAALLGDEYESQTKNLKLSHELPNGSRITCLPGNPDNIVSFSAVTLLIIDEASRVPDAVMNVVTPFLAVTEEVRGRPGRMIVASTPFGKRGWFYDSWDRSVRAKAAHERGVKDAIIKVEHCPFPEADPDRRVEWDSWWRGRRGEPADLPWEVVTVTAEQCPRIKADFLESERQQIGERWFRQEYGCSFEDVTDAVFAHDVVHGMLDTSYKPMTLWCDE